MRTETKKYTWELHFFNGSADSISFIFRAAWFNVDFLTFLSFATHCQIHTHTQHTLFVGKLPSNQQSTSPFKYGNNENSCQLSCVCVYWCVSLRWSAYPRTHTKTLAFAACRCEWERVQWYTNTNNMSCIAYVEIIQSTAASSRGNSVKILEWTHHTIRCARTNEEKKEEKKAQQRE